ncbi:hypothetical protein HDU97_004748 [Phlyctochytrium planicorne]|nr:hypothetical protein HDU97_004748 [Phlyctochytrium planicorne]
MLAWASEQKQQQQNHNITYSPAMSSVLRKDSVVASAFSSIQGALTTTTSSSSADRQNGSMRNGNVGTDGTIRIKVATSKRSMVVVCRHDASVSDFLDMVSSKIIRGFPVGSIVLNPQPVVAAMSRDGYFYDEDDLVRHAFESDTEVLALTNDELRKILRTQHDPFFTRLVHAAPTQPMIEQPQTSSPPQTHIQLDDSPYSFDLSSPNNNHGQGNDDDQPRSAIPHHMSRVRSLSKSSNTSPNGANANNGSLSSPNSRRGSMIGSVVMGGQGSTHSLLAAAAGKMGAASNGRMTLVGDVGGAFEAAVMGSMGGGPILPPLGTRPLIFLSFSRLNSMRMVGADKAVGTCDPHWIYKGLKEAGFSVFIDESEREAGEPLSEELVDLMLKATHFVTCISKEYAESPLCEAEFKFSRFKKRFVVLVGTAPNSSVSSSFLATPPFSSNSSVTSSSSNNKAAHRRTSGIWGPSGRPPALAPSVAVASYVGGTSVGHMLGGGDVACIDFREPGKVQNAMKALVAALRAETEIGEPLHLINTSTVVSVGSPISPSAQLPKEKVLTLLKSIVDSSTTAKRAVRILTTTSTACVTRFGVSDETEEDVYAAMGFTSGSDGGEEETEAAFKTVFSGPVARRGRIYVAYCWDNSPSAMKTMGQLVGVGAGVCDPRRVAARLGAAGFEVWMDVRRKDWRKIASGERRVVKLQRKLEGRIRKRRDVLEEEVEDDGIELEPEPEEGEDEESENFDDDGDELADALTLGMDHTDCMIAFISDEFASSPQLSREFHFAHNVLRLPLIPVVVGVGVGNVWRKGALGTAVRGYVSIDATVQDVDLDHLLKMIYKVVGASPAPEGPRRGSVDQMMTPLPVGNGGADGMMKMGPPGGLASPPPSTASTASFAGFGGRVGPLAGVERESPTPSE